MNIRNILPWVTIAAALITMYLNWVQTKEILALKKLATGEGTGGSQAGGCSCKDESSNPLVQYQVHPIY